MSNIRLPNGRNRKRDEEQNAYTPACVRQCLTKLQPASNRVPEPL